MERAFAEHASPAAHDDATTRRTMKRIHFIRLIHQDCVITINLLDIIFNLFTVGGSNDSPRPIDWWYWARKSLRWRMICGDYSGEIRGPVEKIKTFEIRAWIAAITAHHGVGGDEKLIRRLERLEKGSSSNPSLSQHVRDTSHYDWDDIFENKQRHPLQDEKMLLKLIVKAKFMQTDGFADATFIVNRK